MWTSSLAAALLLTLVSPPPVPQEELPPLPEAASQAPAPRVEAPQPAPTAPTPSTPPATQSAPTPPAAASPTPPESTDKAPRDDAAALRAETTNRLKDLPRSDDKDASPPDKALREILDARMALLDEWDKVTKARAAAENPDPNPEKLAEDWKLDLAQTQTLLDQSARTPEILLPPSLRNLPAQVSETIQSQMKDAIASARDDLKEWSDKRDEAQSSSGPKEGNSPAALRAARDKSHQRLATLKERKIDRDSGLADAKTNEARALARERALNMQWETRLEEERLRSLEAQLSLEDRRAGLDVLRAQRVDAHVKLAQKTMDRLKARYQALASVKESELRRAAVSEQTRAAREDDPLQKYVARRKAELLALEALVENSKNAEATDPPPSLDEQSKLADEAEKDFAHIKKLLEDDNVSHLDALRLNNDFRRISLERTRLVRNELAVTARRLSAAENALSAVEFELIDDARDDRFELENLLERLPHNRHREAIKQFDELERKHASLLKTHRESLVRLAQRAEETHGQVLRRIEVLDKHFGFIRTNLFWVRDQEPLSVATLQMAQRETRQLGRAVLSIANELCDSNAWGWISIEFVASSLGLVVLPWPCYRLRRALRAMADRAHEAPHGFPST